MPRLFPESTTSPCRRCSPPCTASQRLPRRFQHWKQRYHRPRPARRTFFAGIAALGCDIGTGKILVFPAQINAAELENAVNWVLLPRPPPGERRSSASWTGSTCPRSIVARRTGSIPPATARSSRSASLAQRQLLVQVLRQGQGRQRLQLHRRAAPAVLLDGHQRRRTRERLRHRRPDAQRRGQERHPLHGHARLHRSGLRGHAPAGLLLRPPDQGSQAAALSVFTGPQGRGPGRRAVRPSGYIDTELIERNWEDILRFIATIRLKEATASDLFRRLTPTRSSTPSTGP